MTQGITLLPEDVVHLIAAGEVVDSLAAVVRELAENALDAGATRITIALWVEQWRVRVADNGVGMRLDDLKQAATAHSTSKIRDRQDLWKISSLGFRGEALHSLAQLSNLEIASYPLPEEPQPNGQLSERVADSPGGWSAIYNHQGNLIQLTPVAIAPGTIVIADRIFENLPGRRQGLPNPMQQLRAVQAMIHQLALCHPQVTWQVQQSDRDWFTLFPSDTARQILPQILRDVQVEDLQEVFWTQGQEAEDEGDMQHASTPQSSIFNPQSPLPTLYSVSPPASSPSLSLLLGLPDRCHRHRPDWVKVAVNGRFVQVPELEQTILAGFRRTLPRDRFPICLVHLQVPPEEIDWNRHPAKSEIYLHHLDQWRQRVAQAISQALRLNPGSLPETLYSSRIETLLKTAETGGHYYTGDAHRPTAETTPQPPTPNPLKALAQVH
ncbi:MAG: DNA mismatch repair endonuclease MutL, partial [Oscillatoriales cyanobacterium C42_A2020_001]|nr:DNA mismatch repair endonuclease MutL [Leptolyngbyaceae cyanobacterium C42_A2020_001]